MSEYASVPFCNLAAVKPFEQYKYSSNFKDSNSPLSSAFKWNNADGNYYCSACAEPLDDLFSVILYGDGLGKQ